MEWISKNGHCENHCMNITTACYSCEKNNDCDCEKIPLNNQPERSKREDSKCAIDSCTMACCDIYQMDLCNNCIKNCKLEMRCSEHGRNTMMEMQ